MQNKLEIRGEKAIPKTWEQDETNKTNICQIRDKNYTKIIPSTWEYSHLRYK